MQKYSNILLWVCRLLAAVIMLQTLYYKFSGAEESVYIFTQLGIEPWGRIGSGIVELVAAVFLLYPPLTVYGAVLALGTMSGAIAAHAFKLGISVKGDSGQLFIYALLVFVCSGVLLVKYWPQLKVQVLNKLVKS
jgi:uncharacterized membrane protein YphA (DoxX/SURF4 family)